MDSRRADFEGRRRQGWTQQVSARRAHGLVRASIRSRLIGPDQLLVESRLVDALAMSRNGIRSALQRLAAEGLVVRGRRTGTTVAPGAIMRLHAAEPWPANRRDTDAPPLARELERRVVPATELLGERLDVPVGTPVLMVEHIVSAERPLGVRVGYRLPADDERVPAPRAPEAPLVPGPPQPLEVAFAHLLGRDLGRLQSTVEAIAADDRTARLLEIAVESPVLLRETLSYRTDETPFEFAFTWYAGARVAITHSAQAL